MKTYRPDLSDIRAAALGRWPQIHAALGIPAHLLDKRKHQPCPGCGGQDRYRYTDHQESGAYICNQCGHGSGFDLLSLVHGWTFAEAVREVAAVLGMAESRQPEKELPARQPEAKQPEDKLPELSALWQGAEPLAGSPAALYLQGRGLPADIINQAADLRFCPALPYWIQRGGKPDCIGNFPALLAAIRTPSGELQGLHKTYLQADGQGGFCKFSGCGEPLPAKKMAARFAGSMKGAAVHLGRPDNTGRLLAAEGIETALAAWALFQLPAVAALSANGLQALQWPSDTKTLLVCADHDHSQTGIKAARALSVRAARAGIGGGYWQPENPESDALDVWNERNKA